MPNLFFFSTHIWLQAALTQGFVFLSTDCIAVLLHDSSSLVPRPDVVPLECSKWTRNICCRQCTCMFSDFLFFSFVKTPTVLLRPLLWKECWPFSWCHWFICHEMIHSLISAKNEFNGSEYLWDNVEPDYKCVAILNKVLCCPSHGEMSARGQVSPWSR